MTAGPAAPRAPLALTGLIRTRIETQAATLGIRACYGVLDAAAAERRPSRARSGEGKGETGDPLGALRVPCALVMCTQDTAGPNLVPDPDAGGVLQRVTAAVSVTAAVGALNDPLGTRGVAEDRLMTLVEGLRAVLLSWPPGGPFAEESPHRFEAAADGTRWTPAPAFGGGRWAPLELRRGRLVRLEQGRAWWEDVYETSRLARGAAAEAAEGPFAPVASLDLHVRLPADAPVAV